VARRLTTSRTQASGWSYRPISDQRRHAMAPAHFDERALEQGGLSRAWARDHADDEHACIRESLPQRTGKLVILLKNLLPNFDDSWLHGTPRCVIT